MVTMESGDLPADQQVHALVKRLIQAAMQLLDEQDWLLKRRAKLRSEREKKTVKGGQLTKSTQILKQLILTHDLSHIHFSASR